MKKYDIFLQRFIKHCNAQCVLYNRHITTTLHRYSQNYNNILFLLIAMKKSTTYLLSCTINLFFHYTPFDWFSTKINNPNYFQKITDNTFPHRALNYNKIKNFTHSHTLNKVSLVIKTSYAISHNCK